jgi:hypothetical protein
LILYQQRCETGQGASTIAIVAHDGYGDSVMFSFVIVVNPSPNITIGSVPAIPSICVGQTVSLTASGASSLAWSGGISNGVSFTPPLGTSTYTVTGTNSVGCSSTGSITVTHSVSPIINIGITSNDSICDGDAVTLNATSPGALISWNGGINNNVPFTPIATSTYTVTALLNGICTNTATQIITILPNTTPTISISQSVAQGITGDPITYTANINIPNPYTIKWYRNTVYQTSTSTNTWNTTIIAGVNNVEASVLSPSQCLNPDSANSNVLIITNVTDVNNFAIKGICIYPNPFQEYINIEGLQATDKLVLYNRPLS